jgi:hypothetical protein
MNQDVKLTILIPEELRRQAKAAAALRGVTLSEIIREALQQFVAEHSTAPLPRERAEVEERRDSLEKSE